MSDEEKKESQEKDWDKQKQEFDQLKANEEKLKAEAEQSKAEAEKSKAEAEAYASAYEELMAKHDDLVKKAEKQQQKVESEADKIGELDPDLVDKSVITNFNKMKARLAQTQTQLDEVNKKMAEQEEAETKRRRAEVTKKLENEILNDLDGEFSPKYRAEAVKIANERVNSGKEKKPQDKYAGYVLMKKIYKELDDKAKSSEKTDTPADDGKGGIPFAEKEGGKPGTFEEVLADLKKNPKQWKT